MYCSVVETDRAILILGEGVRHYADVTRFYGDDRDVERAWCMAASNNLRAALENLCEVVRAAGVSNLANGVQLGAVSWAIKANDALEFADRAIALSTPKDQGGAE